MKRISPDFEVNIPPHLVANMMTRVQVSSVEALDIWVILVGRREEVCKLLKGHAVVELIPDEE